MAVGDHMDNNNNEKHSDSSEEEQDDVFLAPPGQSQSLTGQLKRNAFLEGELEKLLDDIDRYEAKLDDAEAEIEQLLFQKKKLELTLDSIGFRRTEFEALKHELDEARDKIVHQQQLLDEQEQQIEEQDQIIKSFQDNFADKLSDQQKRRLSDGRKSAYEITVAKKDMQIAMLQAELEEMTRKSQLSAESQNESPELTQALERIDALEKEKEEFTATIAVLKDSVKELTEKWKKSEKDSEALQNKVSIASEKSHDWKRRAEAAEKKLGRSASSASSGLDNSSDNGDDSQSNRDNNDDDDGGEEAAPQALLLQSAISRQMEKSTNTWGGLGSVFGNASQRVNNAAASSSKAFFGGSNLNSSTSQINGGGKNNDSKSPIGGGFFSASSHALGTSSASLRTGNTGMDASDMECFKQINRSLKDANKQLRKDLEKLEKAHKKEQSFNQKLIVKLQKENEKMKKKMDIGGDSEKRHQSSSRGSGSSSGGTTGGSSTRSPQGRKSTTIRKTFGMLSGGSLMDD